MRKCKKARLLPMAECQARPCEVDGVPALFHRWIEEDRVLLNLNTFQALDARQAARRQYLTDGIIPSGGSAEVLRETFALVEYRDGVVAKVKPELVRFVREEG